MVVPSRPGPGGVVGAPVGLSLIAAVVPSPGHRVTERTPKLAPSQGDLRPRLRRPNSLACSGLREAVDHPGTRHKQSMR
jgi:hypothetical protein